MTATQTTQSATLNLEAIERNTILLVLKLNHGNRTRSAEVLGICLRTLRNKIRLYHSQGYNPTHPKNLASLTVRTRRKAV